MALRRPQGKVTAVRSTLLQSSLQTLRKQGYFARYEVHLAREFRDVVLHTLEPTWLPIEVALGHYQACEAMGLSDEEQLAVGSVVGERLQGTFLATMARAAKNLGATPWIVLSSVDRLWDRTFQGGGFTCYRVSPKDARCELYGLPLAGIPYFRSAYRGVFLAAASLFAQRAFCSVVSARSGPEQLCLKLSWA